MITSWAISAKKEGFLQETEWTHSGLLPFPAALAFNTMIHYWNAVCQFPQTKSQSEPAMIIDNDLNFYFSNWENQKMKGPILIYSPSLDCLMYGNVEKAQFVLINDKLICWTNQQQTMCFSKNQHLAMLLNKDNQVENWTRQRNNQTGIGVFNRMRFSSETIMEFEQFLNMLLAEHSELEIKNICINSAGQCLFKTKGEFSIGLAFKMAKNSFKFLSCGIYHHNKLSKMGITKISYNDMEQGNFQTKQTIRYQKKERPDKAIQRIYADVHKKAKNYSKDCIPLKGILPTSIISLEQQKYLLKTAKQLSKKQQITANKIPKDLKINIKNCFQNNENDQYSQKSKLGSFLKATEKNAKTARNKQRIKTARSKSPILSAKIRPKMSETIHKQSQFSFHPGISISQNNKKHNYQDLRKKKIFELERQYQLLRSKKLMHSPLSSYSPRHSYMAPRNILSNLTNENIDILQRNKYDKYTEFSQFKIF